MRVLADKLRADHEVIVFPLGTNDLSAASLAASLNAAAELAGGRCMVVATIARPNLRGSSTAELNRVIEQFASQTGAQVADWRSAAATTPGALGRDRIHATGQGYALRGSLLAEAVQACLLGGDLGGIPAPEDPNARVPDPPSEPRRRRRRPKPPPAKLPAPQLILALGAMSGRMGGLVDAALDDALRGAAPGGGGAGAGRARVLESTSGWCAARCRAIALAHLLALRRAGHPVAPEQLLLALERQPGYLPAHGQALEQELHAALPAILRRGRGPGVQVAQLAQRARAQLVAQRQHVALGVGVVAGGR